MGDGSIETRESRRPYHLLQTVSTALNGKPVSKFNDRTTAVLPPSPSSPIRARNSRNSRNSPNSTPPKSAQRSNPLSSNSPGSPFHRAREPSPALKSYQKCCRKAPSSRHPAVPIRGPKVRKRVGGVKERVAEWRGPRPCNPFY
jgi:hypothetical protein